MTAAPGTKVHVIKSVARTLAILELFDELRRPVSIVGVARKLGVPQSSSAALLKSMVALGFLSHDRETRTYFPTDRVALVGNWLNPALYGGGTLMNLVSTIVDRTGLVCLLGAQNGDDAIYYHVVNPNRTFTHHIAAGTRRPLGTSGVGHVLLSTMADDEIRRMYRRINAYRREDEEPVDIEALVGSIHRVRDHGYYVSTDRVVKGSGMIAMLLPRECTDRPLAIGIGAPTSLVLERQDELVEMLRSEIDRHFGRYVELAARKSVEEIAGPTG